MAGQELVQEERTPLQELTSAMRTEQFKQEIAAALPGNVTPERFVRIAITAVQKTPELVTCERNSVFRALLSCAADGLLPDGRDAAITPFKDKKAGSKVAVYMPMIGGIRKVAGYSDFTITADVVYDGDEFDYWLGENPGVTHKPPKLGTKRGDLIGAYAVATGPNGQKLIEVMDRDEIEHVRSYSRTKDSGPWQNDYPEMCKKTVARRIYKKIPRKDLDEKARQLEQRIDVDVDLPALEESTMTADEANAAAAAGAGRTAHGAQQLRDEPEVAREGPTDAQLNRIARLEAKLREGLDDEQASEAVAFLKGVFGVDTVEELSPEDAERYEAGLAKAIAERARAEEVDAEVVEEEDEPAAEPVQEPFDFATEAAKVQKRVRQKRSES